MVDGERILKHVGAYGLQVKRGDAVGYVASSIPLRVPDAGGTLRDVDYELVDRGAAFAARRPVVDFEVAKDGSEGIGLADAGITVRPLDAGGERGKMINGRVFFANVAVDSDRLIVPTPTGFETFDQLRSPGSPEQIRYEFLLPPGAELRMVRASGPEVSTGISGFEVARGNEQLARISPVSAIDAQGQPVPVHATVAGNVLVMDVAHRNGDFAYPIQVDPSYEAFNWYGGESASTNWSYYQTADPNWWPYYTPSSTPNGYGNGAYGWGRGLGLFTWAASSANYNAGNYGEWRHFAYGNSTIYRVDFGYTQHKQAYTSVIRGIRAGGDWDRGQCRNPDGSACYNSVNGNGATPTNRADALWYNWETHCARSGCAWAGTPGNFAAFRLQKNSASVYYVWNGSTWVPQDAAAQFGIGYIYQWDQYAPYFPATNWYGGPAVDHYGTLVTSGTQPPTRWGSTGVTLSAQPWARDDGLGIDRLAIRFTDRNNATKEILRYYGCPGDQNRRGRPCPDRFNATIGYSLDDMPEGSNSVRARAYDYSGNGADIAWSVKVDRGNPVLVTSGQLKRPKVGAGVHRLDVTLTDTRSGPQRTRIWVDNVEKALQPRTPCPPGTPAGALCPYFDFDAAQYGAGPHTIRVEGEDNAVKSDGTYNKASETFEVFVDLSQPSLALSGWLADADGVTFPGITYDLAADASDPETGMSSLTVLLDGNPQQCAGCTPDRVDWELDTTGMSGTHTVTVVAVNQASVERRESITFEIDASIEPPDYIEDEDDREIGDGESPVSEPEFPAPAPVCNASPTDGATADCVTEFNPITADPGTAEQLEQAVRAEPALASGLLSAGLFGEYGSIPLTPAQASAAPSNQLSRGASGWGLADENLVWNDQKFLDLKVGRARKIVPWDVVIRAKRSGTRTYRKADGNTIEVGRSRRALQQFDAWINEVVGRRCGANPVVEPLVTFERTRAQNKGDERAKVLPTPDEYAEGVEAFLKRYSRRCRGKRSIDTFSSWNEPNFIGQPTYDNPRRAGVFWNRLNSLCHKRKSDGRTPVYGCNVIAGEFLDSDGRTNSNNTVVAKNMFEYVNDYRVGMNTSRGPAAWSIHAYYTPKYYIGPGEGEARLRRFLNNSSVGSEAKLWLTEQGGRIDYRGTKAQDEQRAKNRFCRLMKYRDASDRLTRFYQYELYARIPDAVVTEPFDTALIARDSSGAQTIRDQYYTYRYYTARTGSADNKCP